MTLSLIWEPQPHNIYKYMKYIRVGASGLIINSVRQPSIQLILIQREKEPYKGLWTLPGGSVNYSETIDQAICREIKEELNLSVDILQNTSSYINEYIKADSHFLLVSKVCTLRDLA